MAFLFFFIAFPLFAYAYLAWMGGHRQSVASRRHPKRWVSVALGALLLPSLALALVPVGDTDSRTLFAFDALFAAFGLAFLALPMKAPPH